MPNHDIELMIIGDSHVHAFTGLDEVPLDVCRWQPHGDDAFAPSFAPFWPIWIGPVTAWGIRDKMDRILEITKRERPPAVAFSAGEIDCRRHIVQQAEKQGRTIRDVAVEVADRLLAAISMVDAHRVMLTCVRCSSASTLREDPHPFGSYGSPEERLEATTWFNSTLRDSGLPVLDMEQWSTRNGFNDGCHCVGTRVRGFLIAEWDRVKPCVS